MGGKMMRGKMLRPTGDDSDDDDSESSSDESSNESEGDDGRVGSKVLPGESNAQQARNNKAVSSSKEKSANLSDDSDDSDDEEDDDHDENRASTKRARQDSDDEDDTEDDERDEDEEEAEQDERAPKSKKKRTKISFIDDEAEASDDDTDDEKLRNKDISREYIDKEAEAIMAQQDRRRQREKGWLDNLGRLTDDKEKDDSDVARIAHELEERHRRERRIIPRGGIGEGRERDELIAEGNIPSYTVVSQQSLVPSVSDPNLWMFSCPSGKEQELVYQIMNKCVAFAKRGNPLGIISVVAAQTKGKIYVESFSEPAVMEAVQGVRGVMQYTMTKVPISDMTTVMTVVPKKVPGEWISAQLS